MTDFENRFKNKRVLITGHTGFKGSWLSLWFANLGAKVHGIALAPDQSPNLYDILDLESAIQSNLIDIRDAESFGQKIIEIDPEYIFHLAAQPLVRRSYAQPQATFETNLMGTVNLLEAVRKCQSVKSVVCVTTDKVYRNKEWHWPYREIDELGGKDPYSASKAAAEIAISSYRCAYFNSAKSPGLASARGGNVVGGGDFSEDRLVPDIVRAIRAGKNLKIRNPEAVRPWQHVLSLCHGYMTLAGRLADEGDVYRSAWNFGPGVDAHVTVDRLLQLFGAAWKLPHIDVDRDEFAPESKLLALDSSKSFDLLGWDPVWGIEETIEETATWYDAWMNEAENLQEITLTQINQFRKKLG